MTIALPGYVPTCATSVPTGASVAITLAPGVAVAERGDASGLATRRAQGLVSLAAAFQTSVAGLLHIRNLANDLTELQPPRRRGRL